MDKVKILVIDDEKEILTLVKRRLELEGYEVHTAGNGDEGLKRAKTLKPNLIICDVMMPEKDGFEVLREIRQDKTQNTIFVMLTAVDDFDKIKKAYDDEANFYVTKPVNLATLSKNVRILLNLAKGRSDCQ
ncbi:MAG: response regulator [Candidatus Omnitrophota bacterium]